MAITLNTLKTGFERKGKNSAVSGLIPMDWFVANEVEIRKILRENKMRVWFRGPRPFRFATATLREHATHALVYHK